MDAPARHFLSRDFADGVQGTPMELGAGLCEVPAQMYLLSPAPMATTSHQASTGVVCTGSKGQKVMLNTPNIAFLLFSLISLPTGWVKQKTMPSGRQRHGGRCGVFKLPSPPPCCCYWCSIKLCWERVHVQLLHVAPFSSSIQCGSGGPRTLKAPGWCRSARRIGWKKDGAGGSSGSSTVAPSFHAEKKTEATRIQGFVFSLALIDVSVGRSVHGC